MATVAIQLDKLVQGLVGKVSSNANSHTGFQATLDSALNQVAGQVSNHAVSTFAPAHFSNHSRVITNHAISQGNAGKDAVENKSWASQQNKPAKSSDKESSSNQNSTNQSIAGTAVEQTQPADPSLSNSIISSHPQVQEEIPAATPVAGDPGKSGALSGTDVFTQPGTQMPVSSDKNNSVMGMDSMPDPAVTAPAASDPNNSVAKIDSTQDPTTAATPVSNAPATTAVAGQPVLAAVTDKPSTAIDAKSNVANAPKTLPVNPGLKSGKISEPVAQPETLPATPAAAAPATTSPKAAAVKTRGEHADAASTTAGSSLQAAKAPATFTAHMPGNLAAVLSNAKVQTSPASATTEPGAAVNNATAASDLTVQAATPSASLADASSPAGVPAAAAFDPSGLTAAAADSAATSQDHSQSSSEGKSNRESSAAAPAVGGVQFANLASTSLAQAGVTAGTTVSEGPERTSAPATTAAPSSPDRAETSETATTPTLISPKLIQSVQQSEMRVGVNPAGLGAIEIRATLHGDQIGATISAQQASTHQWLVSHAGELTQALASHNVQLSSLAINDATAGNSGHSNFDQSNAQGQGQPGQPAPARAVSREDSERTATPVSPVVESYTRGGLDLRA